MKSDLIPDDGNTRVSRPLPDTASVREWAGQLGFRHMGIADVRDFDRSEPLRAWLARKFHGEMGYMAREPEKRARPAQLIPGTVSAIMVGCDYAPKSGGQWVDADWKRIDNGGAAYISNYARGRDYHKTVRRRLQKLADRITQESGPHGYRAFCDSAPVMEVALAEKAGLGWRGKHTLLLNRQQGSMFFLGALYTDLPLAPTPATQDGQTDTVDNGHCGSCTRCIDVCPTQAIVGPYRLDARRCISYLTIELPGRIDPQLRPLIGNRVYGCDDCQLVCPWNKFAQAAATDEFKPRHDLDRAELIELFLWTEPDFDNRTLGSAIRRIGYQRWSRNLAIGLGNMDRALAGQPVVERAIGALTERRASAEPMLAEHIDWALGRLTV